VELVVVVEVEVEVRLVGFQIPEVTEEREQQALLSILR
jgi:hypothetical protein